MELKFQILKLVSARGGHGGAIMEKQKYFPLCSMGCLLGGILLIFVSVIALPELLSQKATEQVAEQSEEHPITEARNNLFVRPEEKAVSDATDRLDDKETGTETAQDEKAAELLTTEEVWRNVYHSIVYEEGFSSDKLFAMALAKAEDKELELLSISGDHLVTYGGKRFVITDDDYQVLLRIVESEAPAEDIKGKMLVANVVLNRVLWDTFPNTIGEVVFQKGQFAPIATGYYWKVDITKSTVEAVERALAGEDESEGALFFMAREKSKPKNVKWFDSCLKYLFKHGGHEFFTVK